MANPLQFMQQVRTEVGKVVWPTRAAKCCLTTIMVLAMATLTAIFFFFRGSADPAGATGRCLGLFG